MSGFLHQFANRSLGLAPQVRSRAALPYAAPAADLQMPEAAGHDAPQLVGAVERVGNESLRPARDTAQSTDNTPPAPVVTEKPEPTTSLDRQDNKPHASPEPRTLERQSPSETRLEVALRSQPAPQAGEATLTPLTAEHSHASHHAEQAPAAVHPAAEKPSSLADIESLVARLLGDRQSHPEILPETGTPPAIVTSSRTTPRPPEIATIRPAAGRERPSLAAEPAAAPEVHITIGRLEVNPPNRPAPAAQPPRPRGPGPLSLSDYLARRNGGRP